jgi:hypothetical protein
MLARRTLIVTTTSGVAALSIGEGARSRDARDDRCENAAMPDYTNCAGITKS